MGRVLFSSTAPNTVISDPLYILNKNIITKCYEHNMNLCFFSKGTTQQYSAQGKFQAQVKAASFFHLISMNSQDHKTSKCVQQPYTVAGEGLETHERPKRRARHWEHQVLFLSAFILTKRSYSSFERINI